MEILQKKRVQLLLFVIGVVALSITAEKCREMVGEEAASKSGQFTFLNCFDGSSGTVACLVKEGVKLYFYNIRAIHMEGRRNQAIETALADAVAQGMSAKEAAKVAQKEGAKAAKLAKQEAKRVIGPIISSGWDFFEALYFGGTVTEGFLRGTGTLFGTYYSGVFGEQRLGKFGYLVGSHLGSWVGGRIGLMVYDLVNGVQYKLQFVQSPESEILEGDDSSSKIFEHNDRDVSEVSDEFNVKEQASEDLYTQEPILSSASDESSSYDAPVDESFDTHDEF